MVFIQDMYLPIIHLIKLGKLDVLSVASPKLHKKKLDTFSVACSQISTVYESPDSSCQTKYVCERLETLMERNIKLEIRRKNEDFFNGRPVD